LRKSYTYKSIVSVANIFGFDINWDIILGNNGFGGLKNLKNHRDAEDTERQEKYR